MLVQCTSNTMLVLLGSASGNSPVSVLRLPLSWNTNIFFLKDRYIVGRVCPLDYFCPKNTPFSLFKDWCIVGNNPKSGLDIFFLYHTYLPLNRCPDRTTLHGSLLIRLLFFLQPCPGPEGSSSTTTISTETMETNSEILPKPVPLRPSLPLLLFQMFQLTTTTSSKTSTFSLVAITLQKQLLPLSLGLLQQLPLILWVVHQLIVQMLFCPATSDWWHPIHCLQEVYPSVSRSYSHQFPLPFGAAPHATPVWTENVTELKERILTDWWSCHHREHHLQLTSSLPPNPP